MRVIIGIGCLALSLASIDQNGNIPSEHSQRFKRSCAALSRTEHDSTFLGPFIVHLEELHKHEDFENNVRILQDDQYPFTSSNVKVRTFIIPIECYCSKAQLLMIIECYLQMLLTYFV